MPAPLRRLSALLRRIEWSTNGWLTPGVTCIGCVLILVFLGCMATRGSSQPLVALLWTNSSVWSGQMYRLLTAALAHEHPLHLFFNCLGLVFFGAAVERSLGTRFLLLLCLVAALFGNLVHAALFEVPVIGFSGAVYALLLAFATLTPRATIFLYFIPLPAWLVATLAVVLSALLMAYDLGGGQTAHDVHLVGALTGWAAIAGRPAAGRWLRQLRARAVERHQIAEAAAEAELDRILGKISAHGLPSLTPAERAFLAARSQARRRARERSP